jgi:hypothetical protein
LQSNGIQHQDNANPSDSVRTDALYNASAELVADLCQRYGIPCKLVEVDGNHMPVEPGIVLHHQVSLRPTECPDGLDGNRIVLQAQAILDPPEAPKLVNYEPLPDMKKMRVRDMANGGIELWDLTFRAWADVKSVQHLNAGDEFDAVAIAHHPLGGEYYMNAEDYNNFGQSNDIPYRPWGANVDDLEDYPVEISTANAEPEATATPEVTPTPDIEPVSTPEVTADQELVSKPEAEHVEEPETNPQPATEPSQEQMSEPESNAQPATEPSPAETSEPALSEAAASESTPPEPQITYSDLPTPLNFVTNKAPTNVYDLDMETFAKITAVKELAEGTPFKAVSKAQVVDGSETTYYYLNDQSQSVNSDDLTPVRDKSIAEKIRAKLASLDPDILVKLLNKKFNYHDFPDGPKHFHGVGTTDIDDLNPVNPKPQDTLFSGWGIWIQGTFEGLNGEHYYRSVKSVQRGDWYAIPTSPDVVTHDNEVDHLSSQTISMSNEEKLNYKQQVLAGIGTTAGLLKWLYLKAYFKTKRG